MKKKSRNLVERIFLVIVLFVFGITASEKVFAETYTATTMRLLKYEGTVEIEDASGESSLVMENIRFNSGDSLHTGADGYASVGLDSTKIVSLDSNTSVGFTKGAGAMQMNLTDGTLFLDVQKKLDENETLDIKTSNMTVGIRGTIIFMSDQPQEDDASKRVTNLGVLEGTAEVRYQDENGSKRTEQVPAGNIVELQYSETDADKGSKPEISPLTDDDISLFIHEEISNSDDLTRRIEEANGLPSETAESSYPANGSWTWNDTVTFVAQSASKLYDGQTLTRPGDVLVYGLPADFTARVAAVGQRTDAGSSPNVIGSYAIYNSKGEDVTKHFTDVTTVSGQLVVDPAPMTVWTGSATKVYDGTPLTNAEAGVHFYPGKSSGQVPWRNTAYVVTDKADVETLSDVETLYGISGNTLVHGTNPLTQETREIELQTGQKLTVRLNDENGSTSIEFAIENISEDEIPDEILRVYKNNPALMQQACLDAGWDAEILQKRLGALEETDKSEQADKDNSSTTEWNGLSVDQEESGRLQANLTNVRIMIDSDITDYSTRALGSEEAHYTGVTVDESIGVVATGSQTEVGESENTCEIDWGSAKPSNYIVSEELGTLTVTAPPETPEKDDDEDDEDETYDDPVVFTAPDAEKTYDGTALKNTDYTVSGLPEGFSAEAVVTGSQKDAGTSKNKIDSWKIYNKSGEEVSGQFNNVSLKEGTLTVNKAEASVTTGSAQKEYDGEALTSSEASITGLANNETATVKTNGTITEIGKADNTYTIEWGTAKASNYDLTEELGTLEVTENNTEITFTSASAEKTYDGKPLYAPEVTASGLPSGLTYTASAGSTFSAADAGTYQNYFDDMEYSFTDEDGNTLSGWRYVVIRNADGEDVTDHFTNIKIVTGTLTINPAEALVVTGSADKAYDGTPLTSEEAYVSGLAPSDEDKVTVTATGAITDAGSIENSYTIDWGSVNTSNYSLTEKKGTLEVRTRDITFEVNTYDTTYNGYQNAPDGVNASYADGTELEPSYINFAASGASFTMEFNLIGGGKIRLYCAGPKDAGTYEVIPTVTFLSGSESNYKITFTNTKMTIEKVVATVTTGSATGPSGTMYPVTNSEASISGLADTDEGKVTVTATGSCSQVGSTPNTYSIDWGSVNSNNYIIEENLGTLTMYAAAITPEPPSGFVISNPAAAYAMPKIDGENQIQNEKEEKGDKNEKEAVSSDEKDTVTGNPEKNAASGEEKPETEAVEKVGEEKEDKAVEKQEEKLEEKSEEAKTEEPEESQKEKTLEKTEEKPKVKITEKSEEKPEKKAADKPREETEEKDSEKSEEKPGEKDSEKPKEKPEEKDSEKPEEKPEEKTREKSEEKSGE